VPIPKKSTGRERLPDSKLTPGSLNVRKSRDKKKDQEK
jgi:hypothetical protein